MGAGAVQTAFTVHVGPSAALSDADLLNVGRKDSAKPKFPAKASAKKKSQPAGDKATEKAKKDNDAKEKDAKKDKEKEDKKAKKAKTEKDKEKEEKKKEPSKSPSPPKKKKKPVKVDEFGRAVRDAEEDDKEKPAKDAKKERGRS